VAVPSDASNLKGFAPFLIRKAFGMNHRFCKQIGDNEYETNSMRLATDDLLGVVG
jgi:hypothetical protein